MFETSLELERINQHYLDAHNRLVHQMDATIQEIQRINQHHLELQSQISQQVADEFVKMYKMIDDIKCDRTDEKLNVTIVNELIKIHQSIEVLKHEQNGHK